MPSGGGDFTVSSNGSAKMTNHAAAARTAYRSGLPSEFGTPSRPRVSPLPDLSPTKTRSSSTTLPKNPAAKPNPEMRPDVIGVDSWRSIALYGTVAKSMQAAVAANNARPIHR